MSIREAISKATIGSVVAGIVIVGGLVYAFYYHETNLIYTLVGAAVAFLWKVKTKE